MKKLHEFDEVFDSQKMFRLILQAMSNPTRIVSIEEYASRFTSAAPAFLAVAMMLLDNEVSFHAHKNNALANEIVSLTLSEQEPLECADYVLVSDDGDLDEVITGVKCGTLHDPHLGATVIVMDPGTEKKPMRLYGPGIKESTVFQASKAVRYALDARDRQCYEYPQGIDLIFVSDGGELFAMPRLTHRGMV